MPVRLGVAIILALVVLAYRAFATFEQALGLQYSVAYYVVVGAFAVWFFCAWRALRVFRSELTAATLKEHSLGLALILVGALYLHAHETHSLRVLHDESAHAAGALTAHLEKRALMPGNAHYIGESFTLGALYPSFRQYLFQILLSFLHDFTGYRLANVYILNAALGVICLASFYSAGVLLAGPVAGTTVVALLATLPLFAQNVTSGGYDVLNLALIGVLFCTAIRFFRSTRTEEETVWLNVGTMTAVLLSMARYESVAFTIPWAILVAWKWSSGRRIWLTWVAALSPLFLLININSHLIMFNSNAVFTGVEQGGAVEYFSLHHLSRHLPEAVYYFLSFDKFGTNSLVLSGLGVVGGLFFLVNALRVRLAIAPAGKVFLLMAGAVVALYALMLCQYWSSPKDPLASRFTLPLQAVGALAGGWWLANLQKLRIKSRHIAVCAIAWVIVYASATSSRAFASGVMAESQNEKWLIEEAARFERRTTLFVARAHLHLVVEKYAAVPQRTVANNPASLVRVLKAGLYERVLFYATQALDPLTGEWKQKDSFPENFVLEKISERCTTPTSRALLYRFVGYKTAAGELITQTSEHPDVQLRAQFGSKEEVSAYLLSLYP